MEKLFVYGTLKDAKVQLSVLGRVVSMHDDVLIGYSKGQIKINGKNYPIAVPDSSSEIAGKVLEVSNKELLLLDDYETKAYERIKVKLASNQNSWVYCQ